MILSDKRIMEEMEKGNSIKIVPYLSEVHWEVIPMMFIWDPLLATYREHILDAKKHNEIESFEIPGRRIYTVSRIFSISALPQNILKHMSTFLFSKANLLPAGWVSTSMLPQEKGDVGFCGNWTLEISVKQPVRIYKGMPIGQLIYFPVDGEIEVKYSQKKDAKYSRTDQQTS